MLFLYYRYCVILNCCLINVVFVWTAGGLVIFLWKLMGIKLKNKDSVNI